MSSGADPYELLFLAESAAHEAGELLIAKRPQDLGVSTKSTPTDIVTVMDAAAEKLLTERLLSARPDDGILGEEGASREGRSGVRWVVDPIDGTVNYLYDLPGWAVSVAAEVDGAVVAGAVYIPALSETYTAVLGGGAQRNGDPIRCSQESDLTQSLVATGFGYAVDRRVAQAQALVHIIGAIRDIRRAGAASVDLCSVACGRVDAYYEQGLKPWDLAAGGLIAREAGARVEGLEGAPAGERLVVAAPSQLFGPLHDLLLAAGV
jgi:myo-inositol-1(or 4)-monophosphatase